MRHTCFPAQTASLYRGWAGRTCASALFLNPPRCSLLVACRLSFDHAVGTLPRDAPSPAAPLSPPQHARLQPGGQPAGQGQPHGAGHQGQPRHLQPHPGHLHHPAQPAGKRPRRRVATRRVFRAFTSKQLCCLALPGRRPVPDVSFQTALLYLGRAYILFIPAVDALQPAKRPKAADRADSSAPHRPRRSRPPRCAAARRSSAS